ncbi:MAG: fasciclin domain-containing protein [Planctomycetota bacterium]
MTKFFAALTAVAVAVPAIAGDCPMSKGKTVVTVETTPAHTVVYKSDKKAKDIVDTAAGNKAFSTLVAAVKAAGLVEALKGEGPFTVFAPTNEAFAKLPEGTVESLLLPENKDKLTSILLYHVVPGKVLAKDVVNVEAAETLLTKGEGEDKKAEKVKVTVKDGKVFINKSQVVTTDIMTSNGVIHVIDTVLLP